MFVSRLRAEDVPPNRWRLWDVLVWDGLDAQGKPTAFGPFDVPAGTVTDLASTPQMLRRFRAFDPSYTARRPAVAHDYLYSAGRWPDGRPVTRADADEFLRVSMIAEGYSALVARSWWFGVRSGGWLPWRDYRKADRVYLPTAEVVLDKHTGEARTILPDPTPPSAPPMPVDDTG